MPINTVKLSGYQICDYIWALNRQLNEKEREFVSDYANEPSWTIDTELLVTFNSTLMAGNMTNAAAAPVEWKIYRQRVGDDNMVLAAIIDNKSQMVIDYNVRNNETYIYRLFASTASYITAPIISEPIPTKWQTWSIFDVNEGENDTYHLSQCFVFGLDINSGQMVNNIQTGIYNNFTPYPKIHKAPTNYYSGMLTSMLGKFDCNTGDFAEGGVDFEAALKLFSTNGKRKFLKDIKGHIWEVEITSLGFTPRDGYAKLPYDVALGWAEIAPADGLLLTN